MHDPYLTQKPPKSTGREYYGNAYVKNLLAAGRHHHVRPADLVRAVTVFTALSVIDALNRFVLPNHKIDQLIVSGGGAKNPLIMAQLEAALSPHVGAQLHPEGSARRNAAPQARKARLRRLSVPALKSKSSPPTTSVSPPPPKKPSPSP